MITSLENCELFFEYEDSMTQNANKGIWLYGLSGSGKTYASNIIANRQESSFVIDGDNVREYISTDLGYSMPDRSIQIKRIFGIAKIVIKNGYFPIVSSVFMNKKIFHACLSNHIEVLEITRPLDQLLCSSSVYELGENVVGKDIHQEPLKTIKILNDGTSKFDQIIKKYVR